MEWVVFTQGFEGELAVRNNSVECVCLLYVITSDLIAIASLRSIQHVASE